MDSLTGSAAAVRSAVASYRICVSPSSLVVMALPPVLVLSLLGVISLVQIQMVSVGLTFPLGIVIVVLRPAANRKYRGR
jgi:hypothetical protein